MHAWCKYCIVYFCLYCRTFNSIRLIWFQPAKNKIIFVYHSRCSFKSHRSSVYIFFYSAQQSQCVLKLFKNLFSSRLHEMTATQSIRQSNRITKQKTSFHTPSNANIFLITKAYTITEHTNFVISFICGNAYTININETGTHNMGHPSLVFLLLLSPSLDIWVFVQGIIFFLFLSCISLILPLW